MRLPSILIPFLLTSLAPAQEIVYQLDHPQPVPQGEALARLADLDLDGVADLALSARAGWGEVRLVSGASGTTIRVLRADPLTYEFARSIADAGDVSGDGTSDVLVGSGDRAEVFSGKSGQRLLRFGPDNPVADLGFGAAVAGVGDLDGDGLADVAIGCTQKLVVWSPDVVHVFTSGPGYLRIHSGKDGSLIRRHDGLVDGDAFGGTVAALGDVDGDGVGDLVVGSRIPRPDFATPRLWVLSGASGALLRDLSSGLATIVSQDLDTASTGDLDGDGRADLAVADARLGTVTVLSGGGGQVLWVAPPITGGTVFGFDRHGSTLRPAGDVDGDGVGDLVVGAPQPWIPTALGGKSHGPGYARVLSGADGAPLSIVIGTVEDGQFGLGATGLDDLDGDGRSEVVVSAPFDGQLTGGSGRLLAFDLNRSPAVPRNYCVGGLNLLGRRAWIEPRGSLSLAANSFLLRVHDGVPHRLALFVAQERASIRPFQSGYLCVDLPLVRVGDPRRLDPTGSTRVHVDLTHPALAGVTPGSTWHFQALYRDQAAFGPAWNASDAVMVTFAP